MAAPRVQAALVHEMALELGFDLAGVAPLRRPHRAREFEDWLLAGRHAGMTWLERDRERILDPRGTLPEGRSLLVVGLGHSRGAAETVEGARVARYAAGRDYHNYFKKRLVRLARRLERLGLAGAWRAVADAGPLMERSHAAEAGLGFESKAANLLHPTWGPWFFLGELLLEAEIEPTPAPPAGSCGTCRACIDACPTGALIEDGVLDANRCLSYHTIENHGSIPHELRDAAGEWAFGCDVCSEVCPWGSSATDTTSRLGTHPVLELGVLGWFETPARRWSQVFNGSVLQRPARDGLLRNGALTLAARPSDEGRSTLERALDSEASPFVREAVYWALARAHRDEGRVREALDSAEAREPDESARSRMARTRRELL